MAWSIFDTSESQLVIKQPFTEKYTVQQESEMVMGSMVIKTLTELRWDVRIKAIMENGYLVEMLSLDNVLLETNNPNMREISTLNNAFKKMYSELEMIISKKGELEQVRNINIIQHKWQQVKGEMQAIQTKHQSLDGLIAMNDELFASRSSIEQAVKNNEFFELYFHKFYGTRIPGSIGAEKKSLFMQADVSWQYDIKSHPGFSASSKCITINIEGTPRHIYNTEWLKKAYGKFPITDAVALSPQLAEKGSYLIEQETGKLLNAILHKQEIAHPQLLKADMKFTITADSYNAVKPDSEKSKTDPAPAPARPRSKWSMMDDE